MPIVGYMIPLLNDAAEERRMQSCNAQKLAREQKKTSASQQGWRSYTLDT